MPDIFFDKKLAPMLLSDSDPFDSAGHVFELKLDGMRCLAYLDKNSTTLIGRKLRDTTASYPELADIHRQARAKVILDGELVVLENGKPSFEGLQKRMLVTGAARTKLLAARYPVQLAVFDILYYDGLSLLDRPLMERKNLLSKLVVESERLSIVRFIEAEGRKFFSLVASEGLEGIVAKQRESVYLPGKRSGDWLKIKAFTEEDMIIVGYLLKDGKIKDLVLAQYDAAGKLISRGRIYIGHSGRDGKKIMAYAGAHPLSGALFAGNPDTVWFEPGLVGSVRYIEVTSGGNLRAAVFTGLRPDKDASECRFFDKKPDKSN